MVSPTTTGPQVPPGTHPAGNFNELSQVKTDKKVYTIDAQEIVLNHHRLFILIMAGFGCSSDKAVTIHNSSPAATITGPVNGTAFESDETITFQGIVEDREDDPEQLSVRWATDTDGVP